MSKHLEIREDFRDLDKETLASLLGEVLTVAEDVAFAYDITEEMVDRLAEAIWDHEIDYNIVDEGDV